VPITIYIMTCHGYSSCTLCRAPVCPAIRKHGEEYKWLNDGIIIYENCKYYNDYYIKAYPCSDWLVNVVSDGYGYQIKCGNGNLLLHKYCYDKLNGTALPTIMYDLLKTTKLEYSAIYPYVDLQQTFTADSLHTDFKAWMAYNPEINKKNKERIDQIIQLLCQKYKP